MDVLLTVYKRNNDGVASSTIERYETMNWKKAMDYMDKQANFTDKADRELYTISELGKCLVDQS